MTQFRTSQTALSWRIIVCYALPALAFGAIMITTGMYVPRFYTDYVNVPLAYVGSIAAFTQVWDALTDPVVGSFSDRFNFRWGRRRLWVLVGSMFLAVSLILLFTPPLGLDFGWIGVYVTACLTSLTLFGTMARVPWMAWGLEITSEYDQKTALVGARELFYVIGAGIGAIMPGVVGFVIDDYATQLTCAAIFWAVVCVVSGVCVAYVVPDNQLEHGRRPTVSGQKIDEGAGRCVCGPKRTPFLVRIIGNRPAMALFVIYLVYGVAVNINGILFPFYVTYVVEREATAFVLGGYIVMGVVGMPMWTGLSRRFEKRPVLAAAMLWQTLMILIILLGVDSGDLWLFACLIWSAGLSFGSVPTLTFSMLSDVADYEQLRSGGARDEGQLIGLFDISRKLASSVGSFICFGLIDFSGYEPGTIPQTDEVKKFIEMCYALGPVIMGFIAVLMTLCCYPLNRERHKEILNELAEIAKAAETNEKEDNRRSATDETDNGTEASQSIPELLQHRQEGDQEECASRAALSTLKDSSRTPQTADATSADEAIETIIHDVEDFGLEPRSDPSSDAAVDECSI